MKWNRGSWFVHSNQSVKNQIGHASIYDNREMFPFHYKSVQTNLLNILFKSKMIFVVKSAIAYLKQACRWEWETTH